MVVVKPLAAGQQREEADVGRGVVEVLVADVMAETVDRGGQHEHVHHGVNAGRKQPPADPERPTHSDGRADRQAQQARG